MVNEKIEEGGVQDGGGIKLLSGDRRADDGKDSGANDRSDSQSRERYWTESFLELPVRLLAIRDQLVDGLPGKKLVAQRSAPSGRNEIPDNETRKAYHAK